MSLRRFVIGVTGLDVESQFIFRDFLANFGGWWHWIDNFWLLVTHDPALTAEQIRNRATTLGAERVLVMEISGDIDWSGIGPKVPQGESHPWTWLQTVWDGKNPSASKD